MLRSGTVAASMLLSMSAPAMAANAPAARLVECGSESCLLISGKRHDASAAVRINGHVVAAEGARRWRVRLPVATVRAWSAPYARTVSVAVEGASQDARLPVGMLGQPKDLAMLEVRVK